MRDIILPIAFKTTIDFWNLIVPKSCWLSNIVQLLDIKVIFQRALENEAALHVQWQFILSQQVLQVFFEILLGGAVGY